MKGVLSEDATYQCLLTVSDIRLFQGDSTLAAYCGLAPKNSDSSTPLNSVTSTHAGNKALKNLPIFICSSLVGSKNRFGRHCGRHIARSIRRNNALKAASRKRLRMIDAVMRDNRVPHVELSTDEDSRKSASAAWQNHRDTLTTQPSSHRATPSAALRPSSKACSCRCAIQAPHPSMHPLAMW